MNSIIQCPDNNSGTPIDYYTVQVLGEDGKLCHNEQDLVVGANECGRRQYMTPRLCPSRVLTMKMNAINYAGESLPAVAGENMLVLLLVTSLLG